MSDESDDEHAEPVVPPEVVWPTDRPEDGFERSLPSPAAPPGEENAPTPVDIDGGTDDGDPPE